MVPTPKDNASKKILVIGIGNTLYSDEGVGVHLLPYVEEALSDFDNIEIMDGSTDGIKLLGPVEECDYLLVLDAVANHKEPGTIIILKNDEIPNLFTVKMSIHQMGFQEVVAATKVRQTAPEEYMIIGVQPDSLEIGLELSDCVKNKIPEIVELVVDQVKQWKKK